MAVIMLPLIAIVLSVVLATIVSIFVRMNSRTSTLGGQPRWMPQNNRGEFVPHDADFTRPVEHRHRDNLNGMTSGVIQHDDPEPGYVVLNGVKRRIKDCRNL